MFLISILSRKAVINLDKFNSFIAAKLFLKGSRPVCSYTVLIIILLLTIVNRSNNFPFSCERFRSFYNFAL